ncbi:DUF5719 family protein [Bifidobacterium leontopitheci]|uniref:Organic solvents resistance ABC transporter permease n=1 Tax=Bifidobacterium leontopitheci TaxID=2650774 RepID=A0A6I1GEV3_9BIFI|nr:DUF5719 family protein [Bifidobacterium leontopitheci]KAB7790085.1 hypothetical protein F7D09_1430 [Bifidobacterium leontopitheci]
MSHAKHGGRVWTAAAAVVSMIAIIVLFAAIVLCPWALPVDSTTVRASAVASKVGQRQVIAYCPSRMVLPDDASYGDSAYRTSEGNMTSSARYAAFGAVYASQSEPFGVTDGGSSTGQDSTTLKDTDPTDSSNVITASGDVNTSASLFTTQLLDSAQGSGAAAAIASWATKGDIRGLSAASCQTPALQSRFVLSDSATGSSHQLIIANPSSKSTAVQVRIWGTKSAGALSLSTGSTVTVDARSQTVFDLSAAAPGQDGLYVVVSSEQTPVASIVRSVKVSGLTAHGSDYETAATQESKTLTFPSVSEGDRVRLYIHAAHDGDASVHWLGGGKDSKHSFKADRVTVIDLGQAAKGALGLTVDASQPVVAAISVTRAAQGGQQDFMMVNAARFDRHAAAALPGSVTAEVTVVSRASRQSEVTIAGYDDKGRQVGSKKVTVPAEGAARLPVSQIGDNVAVIATADGKDAGFGVRLSQKAVQDAKLAGVAHLDATSLMPRRETIRADKDMSLVR